MDVKEFESQYREQVRDILNRLQAMMLVAHELESSVITIGDSVQALSQNVERFLADQADSTSPSE